MQTKTKLTVTIDSEVLPRAKEYARTRGVSLSSLVEQSLPSPRIGTVAGQAGRRTLEREHPEQPAHEMWSRRSQRPSTTRRRRSARPAGMTSRSPSGHVSGVRPGRRKHLPIKTLMTSGTSAWSRSTDHLTSGQMACRHRRSDRCGVGPRGFCRLLPSGHSTSPRRGETLFVAWHTISNFYYNIERPQDADFARDAVTQLLTFVEVAETGTEDARYALGLPMADFEDAMQVAAAHACDAQSSS